MISPSSFPVIGAESIVNMNLVRILTASDDFQIDLISKQSKWQSYPSDTLENYGVRLHSINIVEVDNKINIRTILQNFGCLFEFGVAFKGGHWAYKALKCVNELIKEEEYDYVLTKNYPSVLLGWYLKKKYKMKWVASWNDPYPQSKYPSPYGLGAESRGSLSDRLLIKKMKMADIHVFPNDRLAVYMRGYLNISEDNCRVVPHTCFMRKDKRLYYKNDTLKIVHAGNLGQYRDPRPLLSALKNLLNKHPDYKISITFIGTNVESLRKTCDEYGIRNEVDIIPSMEYKECLKFMDNFDVATIIEAPVKTGIFLPTKVGDFIGVEIPIFAISPAEGVLNDMFNRGEISYFAREGAVPEIEEALNMIYKDFVNKTLRLPNFDVLKLEQHIIETYKAI